MAELRNEMRQDALQPIRPARGLIFRQTPHIIGNFLKGYEINVSQDYKDPFTFCKKQDQRFIEF